MGRWGRAARVWVGLGGWACGAPEPEPTPTDTDPPTDVSDAATDASDASDVATDPPPSSEIRLGELVVCADPSARDTLGAFERSLIPSAPTSRAWLWGGGGGLGDLDGDGDLDLVLGGEDEARLFIWEGSRFSETKPLPGTASAAGAVLHDVDVDGRLDVLVLRNERITKLFRNLGALGFEDVSVASGLPAFSATSTTASYGDLDRDGDLDLFIGRFGDPDFSPGVDPSSYGPGYPSSLLMNLGNGVFEDASDTLPDVVHHGYTHAGGLLDLDNDLAPDLYLINDFGEAWPNVLMWNRGGALELDDGAAGLAFIATGMGLGFGDLNGDRRPDLFVPQWNVLSLHLSVGNAWFEASQAYGLEPDAARDQRVAWAGDFVDFDNDGDLEIMTVYGWVDTEGRFRAPRQEPDALYVLQPDGRYRDDAARWSIEDWTAGRGVVLGDIDGDGWVDMVRPNLDGDHRVYRARCGAAHWTKIRLRQPGPNPTGVGARLELTVGGRPQTRWLTAGGTGFASAGPEEALVGLGERTVVDELRVFWPDGVVEVFTGIPADRLVEVVRSAADAVE